MLIVVDAQSLSLEIKNIKITITLHKCVFERLKKESRLTVLRLVGG